MLLARSEKRRLDARMLAAAVQHCRPCCFHRQALPPPGHRSLLLARYCECVLSQCSLSARVHPAPCSNSCLIYAQIKTVCKRKECKWLHPNTEQIEAIRTKFRQDLSDHCYCPLPGMRVHFCALPFCPVWVLRRYLGSFYYKDLDWRSENHLAKVHTWVEKLSDLSEHRNSFLLGCILNPTLHTAKQLRRSWGEIPDACRLCKDFWR